MSWNENLYVCLGFKLLLLWLNALWPSVWNCVLHEGFQSEQFNQVFCYWKLRLVCMFWIQGLVDVIETIRAGGSSEELDPCIERLQNLHVVS